MKNIVENLRDVDINFVPDYNTNHVLCNERINNYLYEFTVEYEVIKTNEIAATYLQPAECSTNIDILQIEDICVYDTSNECLTLEDHEVDEITDIILTKLKQYNYED